MREYGTLYTEFWIDPITRTLSNDAKLLAIYCLSSPHTTSLGCFRIPLAYIAEDLGWPLKRVQKALREALEINFLAYDEASSWLFITKFLKWNVITNPNQWQGVKNLLQKVPKSMRFYPQLIQAILSYVRHLSEEEKNAFKSLSEPLNQEQNQEPDTDNSNSVSVPESAVQQVFECWQKTMGHPNAQLDKKRKIVINKALQTGYNVAQLCEAIKGCSLTPHNLGYNDRGQRYDGLNIILRDADNIDRFIRNCRSPPHLPANFESKTTESTSTRKNHDEFDNKHYTQTPLEDIHWLHPKNEKPDV